MRYHTGLRNAVIAGVLGLVAGVAGCTQESAAAEPRPDSTQPTETKTAIFAGGCFWCMEQAFDQVEGVVKTISGYTGGHVPNPTYQQVSSGGTGHVEAVKVIYDPDKVDYRTLLQNFWHNIDPTDPNGQFCDQGPMYRSAIFVLNERQRRLAEQSKQALINDPNAPEPIVTRILDASEFWRAEDYHQNYYKKNPLRYHYYKWACGRADRLQELWGEQAGKP